MQVSVHALYAGCHKVITSSGKNTSLLESQCAAGITASICGGNVPKSSPKITKRTPLPAEAQAACLFRAAGSGQRLLNCRSY